jgi:hypothetical protein
VAGPDEVIFAPRPFLEAKSGVVVAPFQFALDGNEVLRVKAANTATGARIAIQGRRLSEKGEIEPFAFVHMPNSDRTISTTIHALGKGALLNLAVFVENATPLIGQTFVMVQIVRGLAGPLVLLGTLLQGYVTSTQGLGWPGSPIVTSTEGEPAARFIVGTTPAAGAEVTEVIPTGARWELVYLRAVLTTAVGGIDREVVLQQNDGGNTFQANLIGGLVPASSVRAFVWAQGLPPLFSDTFAGRQSAVPIGNRILSGSTISTGTAFMQAGDQWSLVTLVVREWLEVP